jgi:hypothetical protein
MSSPSRMEASEDGGLESAPRSERVCARGVEDQSCVMGRVVWRGVGGIGRSFRLMGAWGVIVMVLSDLTESPESARERSRSGLRTGASVLKACDSDSLSESVSRFGFGWNESVRTVGGIY